MKRLIKFIPYFIIISVIIVLFFLFCKSETASVSNTDVPVIIIDAGHGGVDGGAVAADGTQEQYINLDIALRLEKALTEKGYRTVMTRTDNNSLHDESAESIREKKVSDLNNRLEIIKQYPDSIFVSIHQNYYSETRYWGAQVFYSQNNSLSAVLAQCIQDDIVSQIQPENTRQIKKSGKSIYLLYNSYVPSVMVECGFLSNYEETKRLNDDEYRQQMADVICNAIIKYINGGYAENNTVGED